MTSATDTVTKPQKASLIGICFRTVASYLVLVSPALGIGVYSILNINALSTKPREINDVNSVWQRYAITCQGGAHDCCCEPQSCGRPERLD